MKASASDSGNIVTKLARLLLAYRNAQHNTTGESPAQLRTRTSMVKPSVDETVFKQQAEQHRFHKGQFGEFSPGQTVLIRDYRNLDKWISGTIVERSGPLSYIVETYPGITYRRHVDQIPPTIQREDLPKWFLSLQVAEPASTFKDSVPNSFCS